MRVVLVLHPRPQARNGLARLRALLGEAWCRWMHSDITWPVNGFYRCRTCWRQFPVPWEAPPAPDVAQRNPSPRPYPVVAKAA